MWKDTHFRYIIHSQNKQWTTKKIKDQMLKRALLFCQQVQK